MNDSHPTSDGPREPWTLPAVFDELDLERHAIIEASAGTGKTYTLEHLVLELVARGVPIEAILVVTFTDKATREMRARVRARLREAVARLDREDARLPRIRTALASFDRASISTIHAFCQRALTEHAFASGRLFAAERLDARDTFGRAFRSALRKGLGRARGDTTRRARAAWRSALVAIGGATPVATLEGVLYAWSRERGRLEPRFDAERTLRALAAIPTAEAWSSAEYRAVEAAIPSLATRARVRDAIFQLASAIDPDRPWIEAALAALDAPLADLGSSDDDRGEDALDDAHAGHSDENDGRVAEGPAKASIDVDCASDGPDSASDGPDSASDGPGSASDGPGGASENPGASERDPRAILRARLYDAELWGRVIAWAADVSDPRSQETHALLVARALAHVPALGEALGCIHDALGSAVPYLMHALLPEVAATWVEDKRRRGGVDFDDMLRELHDAVQRDASVRRALRQRYRHALVDEFQDTDDVQWGIFRAVFVEPEEGDEPRPEGSAPTHSLIVIGDVKQAIYGFRAADVHTYDAACRELEARGGRRARLGESYRSSEAMLDAMHRVLLPREGEAPFFSGLARYEQPLTCGRPSLRALAPDGRDAPACVIAHLVGVPELRLPLIRRAYGDWIAREIRELVDGGLTLTTDSGTRSLRYDDVFVLTRSATEGLDVAQALRRHGVPHAFFKQDGLFRTDEAKHVLDVLRAVASPHDRRLRLRALLTPFFAVAVGELPGAAALSPEHPHRRRLRAWADLAERGRMAALVRSMLEDSGLARRELYLHQSERALTNYRHLLELVLEQSTRRRLHIGELAAFLAERIDAADTEGGRDGDEDVQRLESERDSVQILTMHKSKGLEAEVVFLFGGLGKPPKRSRAPRIFHDGKDRVAWMLGDEGVDEDASVRVARGLAAEARHEDERLYYVAMTRAKRRLYLPYFGAPPPPLPLRADVTYEPPHLLGSYRVVNERLRAIVERGDLSVEASSLALATVEVTSRSRARPKPVAMPPAPTLAPVEVADANEVAAWAESVAGVEVTSYTRMKAGRDDAAVEVAPTLALRRAEERESAGTSDRAEGRVGGAAFGVLVHGLIEDFVRGDEARRATIGRALRDERAKVGSPASTEGSEAASEAQPTHREAQLALREDQPAYREDQPALLEAQATRDARPAHRGQDSEATRGLGGSDEPFPVDGSQELEPLARWLRAHPWVARRRAMHGATDDEVEVATEHLARALLAPITIEAGTRGFAGLTLPEGFGSVGRAVVEMPFLFPVPERDQPLFGPALGGSIDGQLAVERGYVRGVIDMLFEHEGRVYVLDWKTDRLDGYEPADASAHVDDAYGVQVALYTLAALRALGIRDAAAYERFGGLVYVFLRGLDGSPGRGLAALRPSFDDVQRWELDARDGATLLGYPLPPRRTGRAPHARRPA